MNGTSGWRTAKKSQNTNCVEVCPLGGGVGVRDSKDRLGGTLHFAGGLWAHFVTSIKNGDFDRA